MAKRAFGAQPAGSITSPRSADCLPYITPDLSDEHSSDGAKVRDADIAKNRHFNPDLVPMIGLSCSPRSGRTSHTRLQLLLELVDPLVVMLSELSLAISKVGISMLSESRLLNALLT